MNMERFSLLLLEPGEIYFEDFSAYMYPWGTLEAEARQKKMKGRLKICSKSIIFDPKDFQQPILRFSFREIHSMEKWEGHLIDKDTKDRMILLHTEQTIYMKESNVIAPYRFKKADKKYLFSLMYSLTENFLPQACQLHRASTLPVADQNAMINAIVIHRQNRVSFDKGWLDNLYEQVIMEAQGDRITPLVTNPGRVLLTNTRLYFQPFNNVDPVPVRKIKLSEITRLVKRRYMLRQIGLEIYCKETAACSHLYLSFQIEEDRNKLYNHMMNQKDLQLEDLGQENMTLRWQNGLISNFDYLLYLNSLADRSLNDLTQYPVFPWVVSDFESSELDLSNPDMFRDLSKPIGALNKDRLFKLLERFRDMPEPRFLYGSHYSTPGYVLYYLVRTAPELMLCLQNGRFDQPDRMFNSLSETWKNCMTSYSDFKELIPEFYEGDGEFLRNLQGIQFGNRQDGRTVGDVGLPPWASDPKDFINKMREALESDHVSRHLHLWIDLIFGYKQNGDQAENNCNLFFYLTYEGAVDIESLTDLNERAAIEQQIMEFGQTPKQLFKSPHPQRRNGESGEPLQGAAGGGTEEEEGEEEGPSKPFVASWDHMTGMKEELKHTLHKEGVTGVCVVGDMIYSVSHDGLLKVYSTEVQQQLRSFSFSNMPLSSVYVLPDNNTVLAGSWDNNIYVYSVEYGRLTDTVYAHDDAVSCLDYNGRLLVSGSWDSTMKIFTVNKSSRTGQDQYVLKCECDHDTIVETVHLRGGDGEQVASGSKDGSVALWDVDTGYMISQHKAHVGAVHSVQYSPDGQQLMSCGEDGYLRILDVKSGTEIFSKNAGQALMCAKWNGDHVLTGGQKGDVLVWDLKKVTIANTLPIHTGSVCCVTVSQDGKYVVTGGNDRTVRLLSS